jgi:hypothetical protein
MLYATVNSGSITTEFDRLSRAGAAGRMALIKAGAKVLGAKDSSATSQRMASALWPAATNCSAAVRTDASRWSASATNAPA